MQRKHTLASRPAFRDVVILQSPGRIAGRKEEEEGVKEEEDKQEGGKILEEVWKSFSVKNVISGVTRIGKLTLKKEVKKAEECRKHGPPFIQQCLKIIPEFLPSLCKQ